MVKKKFILIFLGWLITLGFVGCMATNAPVSGFIYNESKGPVAATGPTIYAKVGKANCYVVSLLPILGIVKNFPPIPSIGWGKCTVQEANADGAISKVSIVDSESMEIFGIYGRYTLVVYGE